MKQKLHVRIQSAALALMMVLASAPVTGVKPVVTAQAADRPEITFVDQKDPYSGYVITGRSISINEVIPHGYVAAGLTLTPTDPTQTNVGTPVTKEQGVEIGGRSTNSDLRSIIVDEKFLPKNPPVGMAASAEDAEKQSLEQLYVVNGTYNARSVSGLFSQHYTMPDPADPTKQKTLNGSGTATFSTNVAITQYSRVVFRVTDDEVSGSLPDFSIDYTEEPQGFFAQVVGKTAEDGDKEHKGVVITPNEGTGNNFTLTITNNNNDTITINLTKRINYPEETRNGVTLESGYGLRKDTTFELIYLMPTVEPVFLTIKTPQKAVEDIEQLIRESDGDSTDPDSFLSLVPGDSLNYITGAFDLRHSSENFGGKFDIEWHWKPTHVLDAKTGKWKELSDPPPKDYQDVIIIGGSNSPVQTVTLNRMEDDVKGLLTAIVSYKRGDGSDYKSQTEAKGGTFPTKNITVCGTGQAVELTAISKTTGVRNNAEGVETKLSDVITPNTNETIPMDAYRGGIEEYDFDPVDPFQYEFELGMGLKRGAAEYATLEVVSGNADAVTFKTDEGDGYLSYTPGSPIKNKTFGLNGNTTKGKAKLLVTATNHGPDVPAQTVTVRLTFQIEGRTETGQPTMVPSENKYDLTFTVADNTPSQDSTLASLDILDPTGEKIPFTFDPAVKSYTGPAKTLHIPFKDHSIRLVPTLNDARGADNPMRYYVRDSKNKDVPIPGAVVDSGIGPKVESGHQTELIPFYDPATKDTNDDSRTGKVFSVFVIAPSQDPRSKYWTTYRVDIVRDPPSTDNTLASIGIFLEDSDPEVAANNLITNFDPKTRTYDIWIPYSTKMLRVRAKQNDDQAELDDLVVKGLPDYKLEGITPSDQNKEWLKDVKQHFAQIPGGIMELKFTVTSEKGVVLDDGSGKETYTVRIHREDPSDDAYMSGFSVTDADENVLTYTPNFSPDTKTYTLDIPYSVRQIKFNVETNDPNVSKVELWEFNTTFYNHNGTKLLELGNNEASKALQLGVLTRAINVKDLTDQDVQHFGGYHPFYIYISPESEKGDHAQEYLLRVRREEPSTDAKLKDLLLKDQENGDIKTFAFHPDETEYHVTVPYKTTGVSFTPTTNHQYATIEIKESGVLSGVIGTMFPYTIESGATSKVFRLLDEPEKEKEFQVVVTAEDGKTEIAYKVFIQREKPSDDARLKALTTENTENFKPIFIPGTTDYSADVKEGAPGVIITPTANHPNATIKVDGVVVESGTPTDLIELLEVEQTVRIEVIAEDGVTRMVYKIKFTNQNLIEKTSNADLKRLAVNYGQMTPNFQSAVTDYEVTTKENAWSVDIIPRVADQYATMRVLSGTRELGDYNGNYALALVDGENNVTIEVTSPDKTVTKNYDVAIYRNEEEKLKNLTPLEAEDINFEQVGNPIIVKIEEYPRVGASVFNTLREDYPDRSIIFQGNDYSIRFDAKNLTRVIPQTEIYDFRMTFDSPDEEAIYDLIGERSANDDIIDDVVMLYFDYHGSLPGPATFSLSLGRRYANDTLYWHYYNQERDRIDYYGSLQSNSKGNVAVSIDHFSTYIVSPEHRIAGSEDKNGIIDELGMVSNGQDLLGSGGKLNPDTGVKEVP